METRRQKVSRDLLSKISSRCPVSSETKLEKHLRRLATPMLMISNGEDTVSQLRRLFGVPVLQKHKR